MPRVLREALSFGQLPIARRSKNIKNVQGLQGTGQQGVYVTLTGRQYIQHGWGGQSATLTTSTLPQ